MLSANDLRKVAARSGARDIGNVEIDVILTYLLQLFTEKGITDHVAFKGGTMLRKMVFGPRGRLSTDLDFTRRTDIAVDDLMLMMLEALDQTYNGLSFRFDKDKDWYLTDDGCAANPVCFHADNEKGVKIKLQVSTRETPVMPVVPVGQIDQDYFRLLPFKPAAIPSIAFEEAIAEKIRAASQRSKIRDLHDLAEIARRPVDRELVRGLAVLKLWNSGGAGLDYDRFAARVKGGGDYDIGDLTALLRRDEKPDLDGMIARVADSFRFLADLTDVERTLAADGAQRNRKEEAALIEILRKPR
ncbi:MAG: nucleotidyl transferase AbiEii/AbiGii toxin family protein [Mesorhizobium sp.]|uniref:nucleotidyl transferase AbiEii/AbiGii toxin family protein n=1 Tax=Mesorhizobium sp. TaxID=1871066 RepID=UPI000FE95496|nr:nucleotidyl transferase AbiEii/AbiGii toxin family protein [Mesorhizobium sp.]RWH58157.1 MAG: nucleotidyl transferase AbiEii/AbiGii toxin family protein [Mesorhizobium sp.]